MVDVHAVSMMAGYAVATYAGLGFYFVKGGDAWRGPVGLSVAWPFIILCGIYWLPESPRFLVAAGRRKEAWEVIKRMHANPTHDPNHNVAKREIFQIHKQLEIDQAFGTSYMAILKQPSLLRRAWMTVLLELFIMSSGILVILSMLLRVLLSDLTASFIFTNVISRQRLYYLGGPWILHCANPESAGRLPDLRLGLQHHRHGVCGSNQKKLDHVNRPHWLCHCYDGTNVAAEVFLEPSRPVGSLWSHSHDILIPGNLFSVPGRRILLLHRRNMA